MSENPNATDNDLWVDDNTQKEQAQDLQRKHLGLTVMTAKPGPDLRIIGRLESFKITVSDESEEVSGVALRVSGVKVKVPREHLLFFVDGTKDLPVYQ